MLYQSWFSSASTDPATPLTHSGSTFSFLRGIFFGIVILLSIEAFVVYRFVRLLVDPERRLFKVSQGDRPSFAKDFVGVTGPEGTNADHEVLKEELLDNKHKIPASSAHHVTREHHEPWPENVVEFLRLALTAADGDLPLPPLKNAKGGARSIAGSKLNEPVAMAPVEQCHWVNVLAHRFFLALRGSELFKNKAKAKWTEKINKKLEGNSFVVRKPHYGMLITVLNVCWCYITFDIVPYRDYGYFSRRVRTQNSWCETIERNARGSGGTGRTRRHI